MAKSLVNSIAEVAQDFWDSSSSVVARAEDEISPAEQRLIDERVLSHSGNQLRFQDEEALASTIAAFLKPDLEDLGGAATIFERLDRWSGHEGARHHETPSLILAQLHNIQGVDVFTVGAAAVQQGTRPFSVLVVLEQALPLLNSVDAASIRGLFYEVHASVQNDIAGGVILSAMRKLFLRHRDAAAELTKLHEQSPAESSASVYCCALNALITVEPASWVAHALKLTDSAELSVARPALRALTVLDFEECDDHVIQSVSELCRRKALAGGPLQFVATSGLCNLVEFCEDEVVPVLDEIGARGDQPALHALADHLWRSRKNVEGKAWFPKLVTHLPGIVREGQGSLDEVDFLLAELLKGGSHNSLVFAVVDRWIANQPTSSFVNEGIETVFRSTVHEIGLDRINELVTTWFLKDDRRYPLVGSHLIRHLRVAGVRNFRFSSGVLEGCERQEILLVVRRTLGYFFSEDILLPLLFSLTTIKGSKSAVYGYLYSALLDHVGRDFPMHTVEFLQARQAEVSADSEIATFCERILASLRERMAVAEKLPIVKEFQCPTMKSAPFVKARLRKNAETMEDAHSRSIMAQLATYIPLKAGKRTFHSLMGSFSPSSELREISHQVALPLSEITDPLGAARSRLDCQHARKEPE